MDPTTGGIGLTILLIIAAAGLLTNLPAYWVFRKAGWSGWWFLLLLVPLAGLILLYVFAFKKWSAEKGQDDFRGPTGP